MGKVDLKKKDERIEKQITAIKSLYEQAFKGLNVKVLNVEEFKLDLDWRSSQSGLIEVDTAIVNQTQVLKFLTNIYPNEKGYVELRKRLIQIHKMIAKVLKVEYKLGYELDPITQEIEYSRGM